MKPQPEKLNQHVATRRAGASESLRVGKRLLLQLVLPIFMVGMVFAISFIEAPLKFQAPGITIPLGLGIGRLVFFALNVAEIIVMLTLLWASFTGVVRVIGARLYLLLGAALILLIQVAAIRPPLNARTDAVIAGADPGQSPFHYIYIGLEVVLLVLLVSFIVCTAKEILKWGVRAPQQ